MLGQVMSQINLNNCLPIGMRTPCADAKTVFTAMQNRMATDGLGKQDLAPDGEIHRFPLPDERGGKRSGWYVAYSDGIPCGVYGSWKSGIAVQITGLDSDLSRNAPMRLISEEERSRLQAVLEGIRVRRDAERAELAQEATA